MQANAIQSIAEKEKVADLSIVEGFQSEVIARAKKRFPARIPDRKRKVPTETPDAFLAPQSISLQNQGGIGCNSAIIRFCFLEFALQLIAAVDSSIGCDPKLLAKAGRLQLALRFSGGPQHRVTKPGTAVRVRI